MDGWLGRWRVVGCDEMRALDAWAIERMGIPGVALMENAGAGVARAVAARLGSGETGRVAVLCGGGNNGGDGFVAARHLAHQGYEVRVGVLAPLSRMVGDGATNLGILERAGVRVEALGEDALDAEAFASCWQSWVQWRPEVWVDALLGTGLQRPVGGRMAEVIARLGALPCGWIVSVDLPSGVDGDSGRVLGCAVQAQETVTLGAHKAGLWLQEGRRLAGTVRVEGIGFPPGTAAICPSAGWLLSRESVGQWLEARPWDAHKGSCGHVVVVGGSAGKEGAALLAARGALRVGAGLVTVAVPRGCGAAIGASELMVEEAWDGVSGAGDLLESVLRRADTVVLGPGLGTSGVAHGVARAVLSGHGGPVVIDADGLNILAEDKELRGLCRGELVLTPHPGEMGRLVGMTAREVVEDALALARGYAREHGVTLVLKTASTVVSAADGCYGINTSGTPGMASAGMGDVLAGIIGGLLAQGAGSWAAAALGVWIHGRAGELGAAREGVRGLTASGLLSALGAVWCEVEA